MKAKEMFEKLGYVKKQCNNNCITFYNNKNFISVVFDLEDATYHVDFLGHACNIDNKLHKAISKQMKELRWLDER